MADRPKRRSRGPRPGPTRPTSATGGAGRSPASVRPESRCGRRYRPRPRRERLRQHGRLPGPPVEPFGPGVETSDQPCGIAQRPQHHGRRRGKQVVLARCLDVQEPIGRIQAVFRRPVIAVDLELAPQPQHHRLHLPPAARHAARPLDRRSSVTCELPGTCRYAASFPLPAGEGRVRYCCCTVAVKSRSRSVCRFRPDERRWTTVN